MLPRPSGRGFYEISNFDKKILKNFQNEKIKFFRIF